MYRAAGALHRSTLAALPLRARPLGNAAAVLLRLRALCPVLVALALPALLRSDKLQKRAARVGFEWPDIEGPIQKLHEELGELAHAETERDRLMEAGDVLFVAVNIVRRYGVDPEQALRASNGKFERRFKKMEELVGFRDEGRTIRKSGEKSYPGDR